MGFRSNQPTTGRDFYFSPSGDNGLSGTSDENPVADPIQAIVNVNALFPVPGSSNPASINASVSGTYSDGVIVPEFVTCNAASASILTTDAINVQTMGRHSVEWGSLLNFSNNGICVEIAGRTRVAAEVNACAPIGEDGIGFSVSGLCDEIFIQLRLGDIEGVRGIMFDHTANSPTPIQYNVENIEFSADDQTAIRYNDPVATTATVFNISDIQTRNGGSAASGSLAIHIIDGVAVVDSDVLNAETIAKVESGGILTLSAQTLFGNTLIETGGSALYPSIGLNVGDLETQGTGTLQTKILTIIGNVTNAGGMSIESNSVQGDIVNNGTMFAIIDSHVGTLTNNGTINGIINGQTYGNWTPETVLIASSTVNQEPSGTDNPLQISYGAAQGTVSDPVMLAADGTITINESGYYDINATYNIGRQGSSGGTADIFIRGLLDAVQTGNPVSAVVDTSNIVIPSQLEIQGFIEAGAVLTAEIIRDSAGMDDGGIFSIASSAGWGDSSSASIRITML